MEKQLESMMKKTKKTNYLNYSQQKKTKSLNRLSRLLKRKKNKEMVEEMCLQKLWNLKLQVQAERQELKNSRQSKKPESKSNFQKLLIERREEKKLSSDVLLSVFLVMLILEKHSSLIN